MEISSGVVFLIGLLLVVTWTVTLLAQMVISRKGSKMMSLVLPIFWWVVAAVSGVMLWSRFSHIRSAPTNVIVVVLLIAAAGGVLFGVRYTTHRRMEAEEELRLELLKRERIRAELEQQKRK